MLELQNISKIVATDVHIYPTDLQLADGSFNVLLGTTLSGKTTLMQLMAGIERPSEGKLLWNAQDVTGQAVQKRKISFVYQQFINYPNFSVFENIASPLRVDKIAEKQVNKRVRDMAELLKLETMLERLPSELSGGQQQRCALARALIKDATIVFLDEPLANLDFKLREELREELPKILSERRSIFVYATGEPEEALLFNGRTFCLHQGKIIQSGHCGDIYNRPNSLLSAQVFSDPPINCAAITKQGNYLRLADIKIKCDKRAAQLKDGDYIIGLRAHFIHVEDKKSQAANTVSFDAEIHIAEISGSESTVHFYMGDDIWVADMQGIYNFAVGERQKFYADFSKAFYFDNDGRFIC